MGFYSRVLISFIFLFVSTLLYAEGGSNNPQVTITSSKTISEGDSGTKRVTLDISINTCPSLMPIKIKYTTSNGSAKAGSDYESISGSITFMPLVCQKKYSKEFRVKGDTQVESDEKFYVLLSDNGTNSYQKFHLGNQKATITIKNDDESQNADLAINKTNNKSSRVGIGEVVTYTIKGENRGPKSSKIFIWDTLPDNMEFVSVSDNSGSFSCSYSSGDRKIRCRGARVFTKNSTVTVTVKAKLLNNKSDKLRNYAGIESDDSPKKGDDNSANNRDSSDIYTKRADLKVDKKVKLSNGKYYNSGSFDLGETITFKVVFGNYDELKSRIDFEDKMPSGLSLQSFSVSNKPSNYDCSRSGEKITCDGSHKFAQNESVTLYIRAKATKKGRIYNTAKVNSPEGYRESHTYNNRNNARVDIGLDSESITASKVASPPQHGAYYVGDVVTFSISGTNYGSTNRVRIRDWLNKNGSTNGAFEFIDVSPDDTLGTQMECGTRSSGYNFNIDCSSKNGVAANKNFGIKVRVKLKKAGNVCNRAHFYKSVNNWIWLNSAQSCIDVEMPKSPPVLSADIFYMQLNQPYSIDLKSYTTDADTPIDQLNYELQSSLPSGLSMSSSGVISGTYKDATGTFPKDFNVRVKVSDPDGLSSSDDFIIRIKATDIVANDNYYKIPINSTLNGNLITDTSSDSDHPFEADIGEGLTLTKVEPASNIGWSGNGDFSYRAPSSETTVQYTYTIKDKYGQEDYALLKIEVYKPPIEARDDILNVAKNTPLSVNIFADNGNGVDVGDDLKVKSYTNPAHGTLTILASGALTYTPDNDYVGSDAVEYTIEDKYGQRDSAKIFFTIGTIYNEDYVDFYLVNPPQTRNMIGSYLTIGNAVECITQKQGLESESNSFNGSCQSGSNLSNNDYMVRYIDIDGNSGVGRDTWNSSSATFELPSNYLELDGGKGIAWAGLFWQGSINNSAGFKQRRASTEYGAPYGYKEIRASEPINLGSSGADKVQMRIDNDPNGYKGVQADTFYNDLSHGNFGGYYAAYSNITSLLQNAKLSGGEHTIAIANIMTNEGREANIGNYGGWSLVIIYKENTTGRPRNISIYNGYQPIGKGGNTNVPYKEVKISGFKLPKSGAVEATISAFVGEGEKKYGGSSTVYDKMYIKDPNTNSTYDMPASDPNNIFDATIENIVRKSGNYNNIANSNGVDVDSYNVSNIMQNIRDHKIDSDTVHIGIVSKDEDISNGDQSDYVTASMLAFSTELYAPKVCYDYDLKLGEFIDIPSSNREFTIDDFSNEPLQLKVMLRSQEADFDLIESKLYAKFDPSNIFKYQQGRSKYSPPNTYTYLDAIETDVNKGEIAIGKNPTSDGGSVGAKETTYAKLYYNFLKPTFDGKFNIVLDAKISFDGINKVPYEMSTSLAPNSVFYIGRCDANPVYNPVYGSFNIERGDSTFSQDEVSRYSLYTQVVGVPYSVSLASYGKDNNGDYTKAQSSNAIVELELIDGGTFENNSSAGYDSVCDDPDTYNKGVFVNFRGKSRVKVEIPSQYPTYPDKLALKNAIFRTWTLTKDINGTSVIVPHNCQSQSDSSCFDNLYKNEYRDSVDKESKFCLDKCNNSNSSTCYDCLREHFATPICSRDNFAIRPSSYSMALKDDNQTNSLTARTIGVNNSSDQEQLSAGYLYRLETNATKFSTRESVRGYYFISDSNSSSKKSLALFNDLSSCTDKNSSQLALSILNGESRTYGKLESNSSSNPKNGLIINNSGKYKLHVEDEEWTKVDHKGYKYKPFPTHSDCLQSSSEQFASDANAKRGCLTQTGSTNSYPDFALSMHPYRFSFDSITASANPNGASSYVYINDINATSALIQNDSVMAIKVAGEIIALGKNDKELSNYSSSCSAKSLSLLLDYNRTPADLNDSMGNPLELNYALYDAAAGDSGVMVAKEYNKTAININFGNRYFYTPSHGHFNGYFNFKRAYDNPINPFDLHYGVMSGKSLSEKISVDMQANYIPSGSKDLNSTKTLYFAKVKSESDFYDDIYDDNVTTPINVSLFCNKSLDYCRKYGIDISKGLTNEYDWWLGLNHNGNSEGEAVLQSDPAAKASVVPTHIKNFIDGVDKDVTVISLDRLQSNLPYTVYIKPDPLMISNEPWLLYNQYSNIPPKYLYKVRFVNSPAAWSGKGKTGHTINVDSTGRKSKKVDW